jgi:hypothetical protein
MAYTKHTLSASTDGRPVAVAATASPGTLIHTATAVADEYDELWVYAVNTANGDSTLTLEWGGTSASDAVPIKLKKGDRGPILVARGIFENGLLLRAFVPGGANDVNIFGWVNRIAP